MIVPLPHFAPLALWNRSHPVSLHRLQRRGVRLLQLTTSVAFAADGTKLWDQSLSVRRQSSAAVRQFGVLSFFYLSDNEQLQIQYVRVRKANGAVVETPVAIALDLAAESAAEAPAYSDLRLKQLPVKALDVGDVPEYSFRSARRKPEVPRSVLVREDVFSMKA